MIRRAFFVIAIVHAGATAAAAQALSPRNANYTIDVRLDTQARTLTARETLVWTNITPAPVDELQFHLYYNAWRDERSTWMRGLRLTTWWSAGRGHRAGDFAAIDISSLTITGGAVPPADLTSAMRFIAPDDGNQHDRTLMAVALPSSIGPGQSVTLDIAFTAKVPKTFARTGVVGNY